jgi:putative DNA primase/helicase
MEALRETSNLFEMTSQGLRFGDQIICGQFEVMGLARTPLSENWSTVLKFVDRDNVEHELFVSTSELLDAKSLIERLASYGLKICAPNKKEKIVEYIASFHTSERFLLLESSGWHNSGFFLPYLNTYVGSESQKTITKLKTHAIAKTAKQGTLEDWNKNLGRLMTDNSNLILATSTVLAAPLLKLLGKQNYGFNFVGKSSIGKSTILEFAGSVIGSTVKGKENYICNFRATDNALESIGWGHSDLCLLLDEFGQLDPYRASDTVYLLGNGFTKGRSSKTGEASERKSFNITYLSSSEVSLKSVLAQSGQRLRSGLEVRFIDIEASVSEHGCYENLHGFGSGKSLSDYIKTETKKSYGSLFDAYIRRLAEQNSGDTDTLKSRLQTWYTEFTTNMTLNNNQITNRIIASLGVNYAAMMFAIENGLVQLDKSNLIANFQKIVYSIAEKFGESHNEDNAIIEEIRDFILAHEKSRFDSELGGSLKVNDRVGFIKDISGTTFYCVFGYALQKEICSGWTLKQIGSALEKQSLINRNAQGKFSHSLNFCNDVHRAYPISSKILEYEV